MLTTLAIAAQGDKPGGHLKIESVSIDFVTEILAIKGEDFDHGDGKP